MTKTFEIITATTACTTPTWADYEDAEGGEFNKSVVAYLAIETRAPGPDSTYSMATGSYVVAAVQGTDGYLVPVDEYAEQMGAKLVHVSLAVTGPFS